MKQIVTKSENIDEIQCICKNCECVFFLGDSSYYANSDSYCLDCLSDFARGKK